MLYVRITIRFLLAILFCFCFHFPFAAFSREPESFGSVEKKNHPIFHGRWDTLKYATINRLLTIKQHFVCFAPFVRFLHCVLSGRFTVVCFLWTYFWSFLRYLILAKTKTTHPHTHTTQQIQPFMPNTLGRRHFHQAPSRGSSSLKFGGKFCLWFNVWFSAEFLDNNSLMIDRNLSVLSASETICGCQKSCTCTTRFESFS